ncbi:hypothetical protein Pcinc_016063 [Petrolisthes cinctipes]|uniref:Coiled-coil domain-containing protein 130 n=1 Tax=Petrolisthes cinctipes TaxID=88211 RepID=A0AAE1FRR8_PETCI|nr:hypothetical protein Pcinc_016063 [Petrolisthes cinctipes]
MGERKGVNKYYPPDYDPSKGGLNKFQGTHALRERARKLHMGILIIRFEMPYNIWCEGCNNHIGMGVRYNAEKKKVGMYYSTPIYQFRMKCHLCNNHFEIKTDPANLDYEIVSGARRQEKRWDPTDNEQVVPEDKDVSRKMASDAMYKLEHGVDDKVKSKELDPIIQQLEEFQSSRWHDDYASNQALRGSMRVKRTEAKVQAAKDASYNFSLPLLPSNHDDEKLARLLQFTQAKSSEKLLVEKRALIDAQSVFAKLKPKKVSQKAKKDFARQSLKDIVSTSQKNLSSSSKQSIGPQDLGIVCKKTSSQKTTVERQECEKNKYDGDLSLENENNLNSRNNIINGISSESKSSPSTDLNDSKQTSDPTTKSPCADRLNSLGKDDISGQKQSDVSVSHNELDQTSTSQPLPGPSREAGSCFVSDSRTNDSKAKKDNNLRNESVSSLVSYDFSASDSDESL